MGQTTASEGTAAERWIGPCGVGVAHHPLLHDALLAAPTAYDFVELPLDRYLDEAQRALLDPGLARVGALAARKPSLWRRGPIPAAAPRAAPGRIGALIRQTWGTLWRDDASNGLDADAGVPRLPALPLAAALGFASPAAAGLPRDGIGVGLDIGTADLACDPEAAFRALADGSAGRVVDVALDTQDERVWPLLRAVLAATGARRVAVRRVRRLFPLRELFADLDRARAVLAGAPAPEAPREGPADGLPAPAWDAPPVPAALNGEARRVWCEGVAAVHAARQLAQWVERRQSGRVAR